MLDELIRNMLLAFAAALLVNLLLLANIVTCLLVLMCVVMTMVDTAGLMYFWGTDVNFITATYIILSIGLAVDYSAHIGLAFMKNTGLRKERIQKCLMEIGRAVFNGGFSNCLALVPLAFCTSYAFTTFFQTFMLVSILALYHGLIFLPVALSIIGPPPYLSASKENTEVCKEHSNHRAMPAEKQKENNKPHEAWTVAVNEKP
ncbi:patched domain-containing protein 3-like [Symsagittifera roscoffensis]|uniref:patched domain-containing protein 3-like n=1 Tax=Symsagittifera roscoffensis TaxID=84072 RepID=UPI00307B5698